MPTPCPSLASAPMTAPDVATVKALSKVDFEGLDAPFDDTELAVVVVQAEAWLTQITGRQFVTMPPPLEPIATQLVVMRTEQIALRQQEDYVEGANDDIIGSFSAGGYSETKHDPNRRGESRTINSNPSIAELLWMMLSPFPGYPDENVDQMYDFWRSLLGGTNAPAFAVTEVDWSGTSDLHSVLASNWQRLL